MFSAAKISGPTGVADPQFNYVTALLHGDGTNGAQNNTFVDSSSNAFTITRNGYATQGSFSPYGTLWSNYFDGSTSYLTWTSGSSVAFGSGNFTVECWIYFTTAPTTNFLLDCRDASHTTAPIFLWGDITSGVLYWNSLSGTEISGSATWNTNTWYHVAYVKNGTTGTIYQNGVSIGSGTDSTNYSVTPTTSSIGARYASTFYYFPGYISNLRIVKGTAVYTSNFTPPTSPLTAITNTQLLTCQSNRFIDNSTNNFTITTSGAPSVQRFNPFLPTSSQAYSTSVYGGSGYFNGSTDYLVTPNNSVLYLSTNNFTVELWVYLTSTSSFNIVRGTTTDSFGIVYNSGSFLYYLSSNGSSWNIASAVSMGANSAPLNTWIHVALVRNGNTFTPYINGVAGTTTTSSSAIYQTNGFYLFAEAVSGGSGFSYGYSSDFRIVNGSAVYTTNFTPPTAPLSAITNTQLLLSMQNAGIYDNAMMNDGVTGGSAQISTSVKKYGTGSIYLNNATSDFVSYPNSTITTLSGDFTVEGWFYQSNASVNSASIQIGPDFASNGLYLYIGTSQLPTYYINNVSYSSATGLPINNWYHLAIVRSGTSITLYVNGIAKTGSTSSAIISGPLLLGKAIYSGSTYYTQGYLDDIRITNGYARYTSNFTPPTSAFPNY